MKSLRTGLSTIYNILVPTNNSSLASTYALSIWRASIRYEHVKLLPIVILIGCNRKLTSAGQMLHLVLGMHIWVGWGSWGGRRTRCCWSSNFCPDAAADDDDDTVAAAERTRHLGISLELVSLVVLPKSMDANLYLPKMENTFTSYICWLACSVGYIHSWTTHPHTRCCEHPPLLIMQEREPEGIYIGRNQA